jgi:hypothetical protein
LTETIGRRVFIGCRQFTCWLKSACLEEANPSEKLEEQCHNQQSAANSSKPPPASKL